MKNLQVGLLGGFMLALSGISQAIELDITVTGIDMKRGGSIYVMLFGKEGFPKVHDKALLAQKSSNLKKIMTFTFYVQLKEVAVKVWHDEDDSGKVTKNWTGIYPKEGLGFSNGQRLGTFGPPSYDKSKLTYEQFQKGLKIPVIYP